MSGENANPIEEDGIDATHLVGAEHDAVQEAAFELYRSAFAANEQCPCLRHARLLVSAYDIFYATVAA